MTQYFFMDESGDAGLEGQASSSSHFVMAMVQLPERTQINPMMELRKALHLAPNFEFKYHKSTPVQKERFFKEALKVPFRVRAAVVDKSRLTAPLRSLLPQPLTMELMIRLTLRASELDISNEILIIDGAIPAFCRDLRVQFTERCKREERIRPFKKIIGAKSKGEDGLQLADMIAGAIRVHVIGASSGHHSIVSPRIVDLWQVQ